jgi:hypothetical protein
MKDICGCPDALDLVFVNPSAMLRFIPGSMADIFSWHWLEFWWATEYGPMSSATEAMVEVSVEVEAACAFDFARSFGSGDGLVSKLLGAQTSVVGQ